MPILVGKCCSPVDKWTEKMVFYKKKGGLVVNLLYKGISLVLAMAVCLCLGACEKKGGNLDDITPSRPGKPILPDTSDQNSSPNDLTAVYVTVFDDLAILASYPVLEYQGEEPECAPRELSDGCGILCGGDHEDEVPITRVLITGQLVPRSMSGWFRDMVHLGKIDGLGMVRTQYVTDMNHLFAGCERLSSVEIDGWDVSNVTDMTGIFDGCAALAQLPEWYTPAA